MKAGDVLDSRFTLEALVGSGAMGAVFRARDASTGERVAVKVLRGYGIELAARFQQEAQVLASLKAPGIVGYHGFGTTEGDTYMLLEWLDGETLRDRLIRAPLGLREAISLVIGIADALCIPHDRGIVHRDLKPANVFLLGGAANAVKILDFGIARILGQGRELTMTGAVMGTPGYMAPEQIRADKDLDVRCDVYAMGCILFRCVTGQPAFDAADTVALLMKTASEEAPRITQVRPGLPPRIDALVAAMLRNKAADRPANARVVAAELRAIEATLDADLQAPTLDGRTSSAAKSAVAESLTLRQNEFVSAPSSNEGPASVDAQTFAKGPVRLAPAPGASRRRLSIGAGAVILAFLAGIGGFALWKSSAAGPKKKVSSASAKASASVVAPTSPAASTGAARAEAPPGAGGRGGGAPSFTYGVERATEPELAAVLPAFEHPRLKELVAGVDKNIALPQTVAIVAKKCGRSASTYDKTKHTIDLCLELGVAFRDRFREIPGTSAEAADQTTLDALTFVLLHQIGHAIVAEADLAILGEEEAAVDDFATLWLIDPVKQPRWLVDAARGIAKLDSMGKVLFLAEHGLAPQRVEDIACLIYGSDKTAHADVLDNPLPRPRSSGCEEAYRQKDRAWTQQLKPHLRPKP